MITLPFSIKEAHPLSRPDTGLLSHTFLSANLDLTNTNEFDSGDSIRPGSEKQTQA